MFFWAGGNLKRFFENFGFHRVLAMQALQFLNLVCRRDISACRIELFVCSKVGPKKDKIVQLLIYAIVLSFSAKTLASLNKEKSEPIPFQATCDR
ncbi:hypothetical protein AGR4C_pa50047 [Agrobacterium tumefaciens str. Kerr 14]|uniref:Uncharacterized protein n=1 Tax=Agrobacterium tumefaciens str. Kerr 14 TaxID=1183424 RepID=A0A1S7SB07_AGRTU|nr:hypothetical protein AGR4C_pa50047 [Agrobacterium tumefaciens str. Kerr 14]